MTDLVTSSEMNTILHTPVQDLQLNILTLLVLMMLLGRIITYLRNNGGIKNILRAIWEGGFTGSKTQRKVEQVDAEFKEKLKCIEQRIDNIDKTQEK